MKTMEHSGRFQSAAGERAATCVRPSELSCTAVRPGERRAGGKEAETAAEHLAHAKRNQLLVAKKFQSHEHDMIFFSGGGSIKMDSNHV